jgi:CRP-like cAMP-binding protein
VAERTAPAPSPDALTAPFPLVQKLSSYLALTAGEIEYLNSLHEPTRKVQRHREIIIAGRRYDCIFILCSGVVSRYKVLPDGKRQVLNLGLPGDFIGVPACLFDVAVNSVSSLTEVVLSAVSFEKLSSLFGQYPRLGAALFWSTACDAAMYGEHLVDLGRRSAYERLAHLLLELLARLRTAGLASDLSYKLPLTQEFVADVLGLSVPHINRMIRCLREEGLATIEDQHVVIHDLASLSALAGFEEHYLTHRMIPGLL